MVIFMRIKMPKEQFSRGIVVKVNAKGGMDETMLKVWLRECYSQRLGGFFRRSKCLLVMDSTQAHITDSVKDCVKGLNSFRLSYPED